MKKKFLKLFLLLTVLAIGLFCFTGCGNAEKDNDSDRKDKISKEDTEVEENIDDTKTEEATTEREEFVDGGIHMPIPEGFYRDSKRNSFACFRKDMEDGTSVQIEYICYDAAAVDEDQEKWDMSLEESIDFHRPRLHDHIWTYYSVNFENMKLTQETKEETTFLGADACKISGHIEGLFDESKSLIYTALYTMFPMKVYDGKRIPICYIAYGEDTEENRAEIETAFDCFVGQATEE